MRKDFDMLLRNTYFPPWGKLGDHATLIRFCVDNGFGHLMLGESIWCKSAGYYESNLLGGYSELKTLVREAHDAGLLFTLHGRVTRVDADDPLAVEPRPTALVKNVGTSNYYINPYVGNTQKEISARFIDLADMVGADGLYLDGNDIYSCYARLLDTPGLKHKACVDIYQITFDLLTRPMLLSGSQTTPEQREYWCFSGQRDHYLHIKLAGNNYTRDTWTDEQFRRTIEALNNGYPGVVGWIDFCHGQKMPDGTAIEDQNAESLTKIRKFAREHNCPIVLEATMEEINTHPQRDALLAILKG